MSERLDRIDRRLLDALQRDAHQTAADLADKVGLSASPCARRIRLLEQQGFIRAHKAQLDRSKLNLGITIFVQVRLSQHQEKWVQDFESQVQAMAEVINCHTVSGASDYLLQVVVADLSGYEQWVRRLQRLPYVSIIDRAVKEDGPLPIS